MVDHGNDPCAVLAFQGLSFAGSHFIHLMQIAAILIGISEPFPIEQAPGNWLSPPVFQPGVGSERTTGRTFTSPAMSGCRSSLFLPVSKEGPRGFYLPFLVFSLLLLIVRLVGYRSPRAPMREAFRARHQSAFWRSGRSSGMIAPSTGQTCMQMPQSMQISKLIQ